jgi:hypothetical protein
MQRELDEFEAKAIKYAHRLLLTLFLGTLVIMGCVESYNRIRTIVGENQPRALDNSAR